MSDLARKVLGDGTHMRTLPAVRDGRGFLAEKWPAVLDAMRASVARIGLKQVAWDLELPEATISHQLHERNRNYTRAALFFYLLWKDPLFLQDVATILELVVQRQPSVTPEESLVGLMRAMSKFFGQQVMTPLLEDAHREALAEAAKRRSGG